MNFTSIDQVRKPIGLRYCRIIEGIAKNLMDSAYVRFKLVIKANLRLSKPTQAGKDVYVSSVCRGFSLLLISSSFTAM